MTYLDADQDIISLLNDADLQILRESGQQKVKIEIVENSEEFFDLSQEIHMEDNAQEIEGQLQQLKLGDKAEQAEEEEKKEAFIKDEELSDISEVKSLDDSISMKLSELMPEIISKIKTEVVNESHIKKTKEESLINKSKIEEKPVHKNIICDGCNMDPVDGVRYKCMVC